MAALIIISERYPLRKVVSGPCKWNLYLKQHISLNCTKHIRYHKNAMKISFYRIRLSVYTTMIIKVQSPSFKWQHFSLWKTNYFHVLSKNLLGGRRKRVVFYINGLLRNICYFVDWTIWIYSQIGKLNLLWNSQKLTEKFHEPTMMLDMNYSHFRLAVTFCSMSDVEICNSLQGYVSKDNVLCQIAFCKWSSYLVNVQGSTR